MIVKIISRKYFFKVSFKADIKQINFILNKIKEFFKVMNIKLPDFSVDICLREMLNNAIIHGAKRDKEEKILFWVKREKDRVYFFVRDPGVGFNYLSYGKRPEGISPSGWGIFLLATYASGYKFIPPGNKVLFWFNLVN